MRHRTHIAHLVCPAYGHAHLVREMLDSILNQTFKDYKLVVVNDASPDDMDYVLETYRAEHPDFDFEVITHIKNKGTSAALDTGFEKSESPYETWISSDNTYSPDFLEKLVKALDNNSDVGFVYSNYELMDGDSNVFRRTEVPEYHKRRLLDVYYLGAAFMWRRECRLEACPRFDPIQHQDYSFALKLSEVTQFKKVPYTLMQYRLHKHQIGTHNVTEKANEAKLIYLRWVHAKDS